MAQNLVNCSKCRTGILKEDLKNMKRGATNAKCRRKESCLYCNKEYKSARWLKDHELKCKKRPKENPTKGSLSKKEKRRKSIDPNLRKKVWDTYIGQATSAKCFCCWMNPITPFTLL